MYFGEDVVCDWRVSSIIHAVQVLFRCVDVIRCDNVFVKYV